MMSTLNWTFGMRGGLGAGAASEDGARAGDGAGTGDASGDGGGTRQQVLWFAPMERKCCDL